MDTGYVAPTPYDMRPLEAAAARVKAARARRDAATFTLVAIWDSIDSGLPQYAAMDDEAARAEVGTANDELQAAQRAWVAVWKSVGCP